MLQVELLPNPGRNVKKIKPHLLTNYNNRENLSKPATAVFVSVAVTMVTLSLILFTYFHTCCLVF